MIDEPGTWIPSLLYFSCKIFMWKRKVAMPVFYSEFDIDEFM